MFYYVCFFFKIDLLNFNFKVITFLFVITFQYPKWTPLIINLKWKVWLLMELKHLLLTNWKHSFQNTRSLVSFNVLEIVVILSIRYWVVDVVAVLLSTIFIVYSNYNNKWQIKEVKGILWGIGAIGNAQWSGARLVDVLLHCGAQLDHSSIKHIQFEGLDLDATSTPYGASVPADKVGLYYSDFIYYFH